MVYFVKDAVSTWIACARRALVKEGISGVKIDLLARSLRVTRGGFYHNFKDREDLLRQLLRDWKQNCRFLPADPPDTSPVLAVTWLDRMIERLIAEDGYDPNYDMAMREWARSDRRVANAVQQADAERIETLRSLFSALGCEREEARIRARVFYYHQIGYYAIGARETAAQRRRNVHLYIDILCGRDHIRAARASTGSSATKAAAKSSEETPSSDVKFAA